MTEVRLIHASALHIPIEDESVQCVVTSPPYWGLRQYAGEQIVPEWGCALGLEPTPELYVEHMVEVFREVRRVLRPDGTLWLNLGDSYNAQPAGNKTPSGFSQTRPSRVKHGVGDETVDVPRPKSITGLKPKDLVGIPWRVAFALQADGWYLRSDIIWHKPNPMPESVTDRPTKAHEYVFLMAKSERYFYDADAIREPSVTTDPRRPYTSEGAWELDGRPKEQRKGGQRRDGDDFTGRNKRTVWTIPTRPYKGAHFATFPPDLVEPCVLAGSSPKACGVCGAPWERIIERESRPNAPSLQGKYNGYGKHRTISGGVSNDARAREDRGWRSTCEHKDDSGACVVLDPFNGSGTTGQVAVRLGRSYVGVDISKEYLDEQAVRRIYDVQMEAAL